MLDLFLLKNIDPVLMASERQRVLEMLEKWLPRATVMEIGSTAIPNVIGKQDIDFMVKTDSDNFPETRAILDRNLKRNPDQLSTDNYQGYHVDSPLDVAAQLVVGGSEHDVFEDFLALLKADPGLVNKYNDLKRQWNGKPMDEYRAEKSRFIEAVLLTKNRATFPP